MVGERPVGGVGQRRLNSDLVELWKVGGIFLPTIAHPDSVSYILNVTMHRQTLGGVSWYIYNKLSRINQEGKDRGYESQRQIKGV